MVFSSIVFLLYFLPAFLIAYYAIGKKYKNFIILLFSILFYSWGAPKFIFVLIGVTIFDYHIVQWMSREDDISRRRLLMVMSIAINLSLLFYFKYFNFFIENTNFFLSNFGIKNIQWAKIIMPIGISFYTFETITYVVDVYNKKHLPLTNFGNYLLYIILFPKLIAGPIVRYHDIADQIEDRSQNETIENRLTGFYRFVIGLAKKVLIANYIGEYADDIFEMKYSDLNLVTAWTGLLAYTFQIYFDFAGYSDMAIGICKMIGFKIPENFNNPYTSGSITEFWRRWHISLGNWMREYLYIPLGGNRVSSKLKLYFNLWFVFLISGLWHGASWNYVFWGAYHGLFLIAERLFLNKFYAKAGKLVSTIFTFIIIAIGWAFFKIESLSEAFAFVKRLFFINPSPYYSFDSRIIFYFAVAIFFSAFTYFERGQKMQQEFYFNNYSNSKHIFAFIICGILLILSIASITSEGFNPFIYFRF